MDLAALNRKVTALENKQHVNYSSISGSAFSISYNGTTLSVESNGTLKANTVIVADNLAEDNEERLEAVEEKVAELDSTVDFILFIMTDLITSYIKDHTHTISDITDLIVSDTILATSPGTLTEGTNYFNVSLEKTQMDGVNVCVFKFVCTAEFNIYNLND